MDHADEMIIDYDEEAEATGWYGPEVAFGLTYSHVQPGQSMLDLGIGTGLGSILFLKAGLKIHGMDISPQMLDVCRNKGFSSLHLHDVTKPPYPFDSESMDHAVCTGVFNFFSDLSPFFQETGRILRKNGLFVFVVGDRSENDIPAIEVGTKNSKSEKTVKMCLHSTKSRSPTAAIILKSMNVQVPLAHPGGKSRDYGGTTRNRLMGFQISRIGDLLL